MGGEIVTTHSSGNSLTFGASTLQRKMNFGSCVKPPLKSHERAVSTRLEGTVSPWSVAAAVPGFAASTSPDGTVTEELRDGFAAAHTPARLSTGLLWRL